MKSVYLNFCAHLMLLVVIIKISEAKVIDISLKKKAENILESSKILQKSIDDLLGLAREVELSPPKSFSKPNEIKCGLNEKVKTFISDSEKETRAVIGRSYDILLQLMREVIFIISDHYKMILTTNRSFCFFRYYIK